MPLVSISPAGTTEGTGFLCVFASYHLAYEFAGVSGASGISAARATDSPHGTFSNRSLFSLVIGLTVPTLGKPEMPRANHVAYLFLPRATASLASLSAVRRRSVSRLSQSCLPFANASSTFTLPFLK